MLPKEQKEFWRPEALKLRKMFPVTGVIHALFVIFDIAVYGEILLILVDIGLVWLDFYNYMILNKICVSIEIVIHVLVTLVSITHIQRGLQSEEVSNFTVGLFVC